MREDRSFLCNLKMPVLFHMTVENADYFNSFRDLTIVDDIVVELFDGDEPDIA